MILRVRTTGNGIAFRCPGCGDMHVIPTIGSPSWSWNGSREHPSITPSVDIKAGHHASHWKPGDECWCGKDYGFSCYRCHSIITNGEIAFQSDCTHALAGKTVALPEIA